jgi:hypothetical protein
MSPKKERKLKSVLFGLVLLVITVGVTEGFVRLLLPPPGLVETGQAIPGLLIPHPTREYTYAPGFVGSGGNRQNHVDISINSMGLRDDDVRPGEVIDILACGDSYTAGWGVAVEDAWPTVLESALNAKLRPAAPIRVLDGGVSGYNLAQIRLLVEEMLVLKPRVVVLGLPPHESWRLENPYVYFDGMAVMSSLVGQVEATKGGYLYSNCYREDARRLHFWMMHHFHSGAYLLAGVQILRQGRHGKASTGRGPMREGELDNLLKELELIRVLVQGEDAKLVVLLVNEQETSGRFGDVEREYNATVKDYCSSRGIPCFDPLPLFESVTTQEPVFRQGDDFHWSKRAHELAGRELGAFMINNAIVPATR